ncbi:hypothetical protein [Ochrobactrum soli]|uniref:hypothetical protein n=1 Tax=Ochrobactrum soli TaxID=2448455 RepID=UPI001435622C|nr:hypothetical protein [[Ochrobactrum] soli]
MASCGLVLRGGIQEKLLLAVQPLSPDPTIFICSASFKASSKSCRNAAFSGQKCNLAVCVAIFTGRFFLIHRPENGAYDVSLTVQPVQFMEEILLYACGEQM